MVINVAWLHSAARFGLQAGAPEWMKAVWGLSVPYFFLLAMFWQAKRSVEVRSMSVEVRRLVKRILVPYFLWCWLGAVWSIALHGVQLKGWEALRYLGLQAGWDPAYQPMWFLKALFVVLVGETVFLNAGRFIYRRLTRKFGQMTLSSPRGYADDKGHQPELFVKLRRLVFPVYVLHSMFVSLAGVGFERFGTFERFEMFERCETFSCLGVQMFSCLGIAIAAVGLSVLSAIGLKKLMPRVACVLFGGR